MSASSLHTHSLTVRTNGIGFHELTGSVDELIARSGIESGLAIVFVRHTSASLLIQEGADPTVLDDLLSFMSSLVPEGGGRYTHTLEGSDDMPSHIRSMLTHTSEVIPVANARLDLGKWQQLFLFEHRRSPRTREIRLLLLGG